MPRPTERNRRLRKTEAIQTTIWQVQKPGFSEKPGFLLPHSFIRERRRTSILLGFFQQIGLGKELRDRQFESGQ